MVTNGRNGAVWPGRADAPPVLPSMETMPEATADIEVRVRAIVSRWNHDPTGLVQILREVQEEFG